MKKIYSSIPVLILIILTIFSSIFYSNFIKFNLSENTKERFKNHYELALKDIEKRNVKIKKIDDKTYYCLLEFIHYREGRIYDTKCNFLLDDKMKKSNNRQFVAIISKVTSSGNIDNFETIPDITLDFKYLQKEMLGNLVIKNFDNIKTNEFSWSKNNSIYLKRNHFLLNNDFQIFLKHSAEKLNLKNIHEYFSNYNFIIFSIFLIPLFFIKKLSFFKKLTAIILSFLIFQIGQSEATISLFFILLFFIGNFFNNKLEINSIYVYRKNILYIKFCFFILFLAGNINFGFVTNQTINNSMSLGMEPEILNLYLIILLILNYFIFQILVNCIDLIILRKEYSYENLLFDNIIYRKPRFFKNINNISSKLNIEDTESYISHFNNLKLEDKKLVRNYIINFITNKNGTKLRSIDNCFFIFINLVFLNSKINDGFNNFYNTIFSEKKILDSHWIKHLEYLEKNNMEEIKKILEYEYHFYKYKK